MPQDLPQIVVAAAQPEGTVEDVLVAQGQLERPSAPDWTTINNPISAATMAAGIA